jgi:hypothetical protein
VPNRFWRPDEQVLRVGLDIVRPQDLPGRGLLGAHDADDLGIDRDGGIAGDDLGLLVAQPGDEAALHQQATHIQLALGPLIRPGQTTEHPGRELHQPRPNLRHLLRSHDPNEITNHTRSAGTTHLTKYY